MAARAPDPLRIIIVVAVLAAVGIRVHYWLSGARRNVAYQSGTGSIAGRIVRFDGSPAARAFVWGRGQGAARAYGEARADADGRFEITGLAAAPFRLESSGRGSLRARSGDIVPGIGAGLIRLAPGERREGVVLRLWPVASLSGRVFTEAGAPKPGCSVRATPAVERFDRYEGSVSGYSTSLLFSGVPVTKTDKSGEYTLPEVAPGEYVVAAASDPNPLRVAYFPNATRFADAARVTVAPGDARPGVDIRDAPLRTGDITGRVTGADGAGLVAQVSLVPAAHAEARRELRAASSREGVFSFANVPVDDYLLRAHLENGIDHFWALAPVSVRPGRSTDAALVLEPGATVTVDIDRRDLPAAQGSQESLTYLQVAPTDRASGAWLAELGSFQDSVGEDASRLTLRGVPPGTYVFRAGHVSGQCNAFTIDGRNALDAPVSVASGSQHAGRASIIPSLAEIGGRVVGPRPPMTGIVVIFPVDPSLRNPPRRAQAQRVNPDGSYLFGNVPSGEYFVAFSADVATWTSTWFDPMSAGASRVTLSPGERQTADLNVR
jgi:hypothetical protein